MWDWLIDGIGQILSYELVVERFIPWFGLYMGCPLK